MVWLLWLHDTVLGVYATKAPAVSHAQLVMYRDFPDEQFFERRQSGGGIRWHSHRISRLEVEPFEVRDRP
jgi:hypothetical protein